MKIALDFDETYTADPGLWDAFVGNALQRGHQVVIVSFRFEGDGDDIAEVADRLGIQFILTSARQKQHVVEADIWIDDAPECVVSEAAMRKMLHGCEVNGDFSTTDE